MKKISNLLFIETCLLTGALILMVSGTVSADSIPLFLLLLPRIQEGQQRFPPWRLFFLSSSCSILCDFSYLCGSYL